jgi:hypothetical protein
MNKVTAVEWLVEQISYTTTNKEIISYHKDISELVNQALEMFEQQIIDAVESYCPEWIDAENYYQETFKSE